MAFLRPCHTLERSPDNKPAQTGRCSHPGMGCSHSEKHQQTGWVCRLTHHYGHSVTRGSSYLLCGSRLEIWGLQISGQGLCCNVSVFGSGLTCFDVIFYIFVTSAHELVISANRALYICNLNDMRLNKMDLSINWYLNIFSSVIIVWKRDTAINFL